VKLQDKNTIVTGGASGFGAGIVARFLEEGANVTIVDFDENGSVGVHGIL
jgi:3-oxoacyl-[acyl-carrier protein] reductase